MATVNLGRIKFVWQGAYSGATAYVADDVVSYNGSSYICILASTGNLPTNATYWSQMSSAGTNGTDLTSTLTTQGDIVYRNASGLARLGAGTSGQFLKTNGSGANPAWDSVVSGILQVKQVVKTDTFSHNTNTYTDVTGLSLSITPSSASNKILCLVDCATGGNGSGDDSLPALRLIRNSTAIYIGDADGSRTTSLSGHYIYDLNSQVGNQGIMRQCGTFLDAPNTTSSTTYKIQIARFRGQAVYVNRSGVDGNDSNGIRVPSSLTLIEVASSILT